MTRDPSHRYFLVVLFSREYVTILYIYISLVGRKSERWDAGGSRFYSILIFFRIGEDRGFGKASGTTPCRPGARGGIVYWSGPIESLMNSIKFSWTRAGPKLVNREGDRWKTNAVSYVPDAKKAAPESEREVMGLISLLYGNRSVGLLYTNPILLLCTYAFRFVIRLAKPRWDSYIIARPDNMQIHFLLQSFCI